VKEGGDGAFQAFGTFSFLLAQGRKKKKKMNGAQEGGRK